MAASSSALNVGLLAASPPRLRARVRDERLGERALAELKLRGYIQCVPDRHRLQHHRAQHEGL